MGAFVSNVASGKIAYYGSLPAANDAFVWILLRTTNLASDATLRDYTTVAALLTGGTAEASFTGYGRVISTAGATVTVDQANNVVNCDAADPVWSTSTSAQALGGICLAYDPDTNVAGDGTLIPLWYHTSGTVGSGANVWPVNSPTAGSFTYNVAAAGWARAVPA